MARKLVLLHMHHPKLYAFLNALVNIFVKGLPFTIYFWFSDTSMWVTNGENAAQSAINGVMNIIIFFMSFLMGMFTYLLFLGIVQFIKLIACSYKRVNIHIHILGIIIKLGRSKILDSGDKEAIDALYFHEECAENRKERIYRGKEYAAERKRESQEEELICAKEDFEWQKRHAEDAKASADNHYKNAREGGGWFTSASEEAELGSKAMKDVHYYEGEAARREQEIADLERRLGK